MEPDPVRPRRRWDEERDGARRRMGFRHPRWPGAVCAVLAAILLGVGGALMGDGGLRPGRALHAGDLTAGALCALAGLALAYAAALFVFARKWVVLDADAVRVRWMPLPTPGRGTLATREIRAFAVAPSAVGNAAGAPASYFELYAFMRDGGRTALRLTAFDRASLEHAAARLNEALAEVRGGSGYRAGYPVAGGVDDESEAAVEAPEADESSERGGGSEANRGG